MLISLVRKNAEKSIIFFKVTVRFIRSAIATFQATITIRQRARKVFGKCEET